MLAWACFKSDSVLEYDSSRRASGHKRVHSMTSPMPSTNRRLACARCGTAFECSPGGGCWCDAEPYRLPMPDAATEDCLCPACLRQAAAEQDRARLSGG
jgi:hypothetical protein